MSVLFGSLLVAGLVAGVYASVFEYRLRSEYQDGKEPRGIRLIARAFQDPNLFTEQGRADQRRARLGMLWMVLLVVASMCVAVVAA